MVADGLDMVVCDILNLNIAMVVHPDGMFGNKGEVPFRVFAFQAKRDDIWHGLGLNDAVKQESGGFIEFRWNSDFQNGGFDFSKWLCDGGMNHFLIAVKGIIIVVPSKTS